MRSLLRKLTKRDWVVALGLGLLAALMMFQYWGPPVRFTDPDALFYQAQSEEVRGSARQAALEEVFGSDLATELKEGERDEPAAELKVSNSAWVEYSSRFYRRRWTLPVTAAAVSPVLGDGTLETLTLTFYVVGTMLLYLLLRRRFGTLVSVLVTAATLLLPPLRLVASNGLTDSLGLTLLIAALLCASLVLERGRRWLWAWVAVILLLSFTRDLTLVLLVTAAWLALRLRTPTSYLLLGSGFLASLPAPLLAGAPFRENLAYVIDDYAIPTDSSWGYVIDRYPGQLWETISGDFTYPLEFAFPAPMFLELAVIVAGAVTLFAIRSREDLYFSMMRAALLGAALTILISVNFTQWRLELAMLPSIAVGVALLAELIIARLPGRLGGERLRALDLSLPQAPAGWDGAASPTRKPS